MNYLKTSLIILSYFLALLILGKFNISSINDLEFMILLIAISFRSINNICSRENLLLATFLSWVILSILLFISVIIMVGFHFIPYLFIIGVISIIALSWFLNFGISHKQS
jgi:hypothetical protein